MTWQEIYSKYKYILLMDEFLAYMFDERHWKFNDNDMINFNIKDIWGYLICFAETKDYRISICHYVCHINVSIFQKKTEKWKRITVRHSDTIEAGMLYCADKFFEVAK